MSKKKTELYPIDRSGLWKIGTQRAVADLLHHKLPDLKRIVRNREHFYWFSEESIGGKARHIQCPVKALRIIHERLKELLNRVSCPPYLHAPRHNHSYITNATAHVGAPVLLKLDIRQFYPSTTDEHVFKFFHHRLGIIDDVAGFLTKLCTVRRRLPFGSPLSPILCFHVHRDAFDRISALCDSHALRMTLYVDDITVSGQLIPGAVIYEIKKIIHSAGLRYHEVKRVLDFNFPVVTGIQIRGDSVRPANKSHLSMRDKLKELDSTTDPAARIINLDSLLGLNQHMILSYSTDDPARKRLNGMRTWLRQERKKAVEALDAKFFLRS